MKTMDKKRATANTGNLSTGSIESNSVLFRSNPLPIIIYEIGSFAIVDVNEMACKLYGYQANEFTALTIKDIIALKDGALTAAAIASPNDDGELNNAGAWDHVKKMAKSLK